MKTNILQKIPAIRSLSVAVLAVVLALGVAPVPLAHAGGIVVTTTADELNNDGDCSLREAIRAANTDSTVDGCFAGSGADVISLGIGTYTLSIVGQNENAAVTGDLDITSDMTIVGVDSAKTILDAGKVDRLFDIRAGNVLLSNLGMRNGFTQTSGDDANNGKLVWVGNATATIINSTLSGSNEGNDGSGLHALMNEGALNLINSSITKNNCGGVRNIGTMVINHSTISANYNDHFAAGIRNDGTLTVVDSIIRNNMSGDLPDAGGILNYGTLMMRGTEVVNNRSNESPGGIDNFGRATIIDSQFRGNIEGGDLNGLSNGDPDNQNPAYTMTVIGTTVEDGLYNSGRMQVITSRINVIENAQAWMSEAGQVSIVSSTLKGISNGGAMQISRSMVSGRTDNSGTLSIDRSTISGVRTTDFGSVYNSGALAISGSTFTNNQAKSGGGIYNTGTLHAVNTTISGNRSTESGAGIYNTHATDWEGNFRNAGVVTLNNVTIANNTADSNYNGTGDGGGMYNDHPDLGNRVVMQNSIMANNKDGGGQAPDCAGIIESAGYNLIRSTKGCTITGNTTGNKTGVDPKLGYLAKNGGLTAVHALNSGSPAIDAANPNQLVSGANICALSDQRGARRPQDGNGDGKASCDIGAFERGVVPTSASGSIAADDAPAASDEAASTEEIPTPEVMPLNTTAIPAQMPTAEGAAERQAQ